MLVGVGYFFVWTMFGMAAFPLGVTLTALEMQQPALARAVPITIGVVVLIGGAFQFTAWKARHLACCREAPGRGRVLPADAGTAWRHGLRIGLHCSYSCAGLTAVLLVIGVMDLRAMTVVTAAITIERLAPAGERVARAIGSVAVGTGLFLIVQAGAFLVLNYQPPAESPNGLPCLLLRHPVQHAFRLLHLQQRTENPLQQIDMVTQHIEEIVVIDPQGVSVTGHDGAPA